MVLMAFPTGGAGLPGSFDSGALEEASGRRWEVPGCTGLRALGSGGFGDVVLARHDASGTMVAIKYLRPELLADPGFAELFRAEARVLASLNDQHVVRHSIFMRCPEIRVFRRGASR